MYLSNVEIFGFKSFAKKVKLHFDRGITAVVGPNGCGKTNVVDAIRWVLGEQKVSTLRGERMENVIFAGSNTRKPIGMSEVSLLIENTNNVLPIEYSEVLLTRRLFRSGESEYLINKTPCRLKDIQNLFADTGMGSDAYSVVELKMVETILNDKNDERRRLFEEAAGITKYKARRESALSKLAATSQDLIRVNDIISEVERQVNSLKRQVGKYKRFKAVQDQFKSFERTVFLAELADNMRQQEPLKQSVQAGRDRIARIVADITQAESQLANLQELHTACEAQLQEQEKKYNNITGQLNEVSTALEVNKHKRSGLEESNIRLTEECERLQLQVKRYIADLSIWKEDAQKFPDQKIEYDRLAEFSHQQLESFYQQYHAKKDTAEQVQQQFFMLMEQLGNAQRDYDRLKNELKERESRKTTVGEQRDHLRNTVTQEIQQFEALQFDRKKLLESLDQKSERLDDLTSQCSSGNAVIRELDDAILQEQTRLENYQGQLEFLQQLVIAELEDGYGENYLIHADEQVAGVQGMIRDVIRMDERYATAIDTALGSRKNYVVIDSMDHAFAAIQQLKDHHAGKATLVPMDKVTELQEWQQEATTPAVPGVLGWVHQFIKTDSEYTPLLKVLFRNMLLIEHDITEFYKRHAGNLNGYTYIDLNGGMIDASGSITGGDGVHMPESEFEREDKISQLQNSIEESKHNLSTWKQERFVKHSLIEKTVAEIAQLEFDVTNQQQSLNDLDRQIALKNQAIEQERATEANLGQELEQLNLFTANTEALQSLDQQIIEFEAQKEKVSLILENMRREMQNLEKTRNQLEKEAQEKRLQQVQYEEKEKRLLNDIQQLEEKIADIHQRVESNTTTIQTNKELIESCITDIDQQEKTNQELFSVRDEIDEEREQLRSKRNDLWQQLTEIEKCLKELRIEKDRQNDSMHTLDLQLTQLQAERKQLEEKIGSYDRAEIEAIEQDKLSLDERRRKLENMHRTLGGLGTINQAAIEEFEEVKQRFDVLIQQRTDILEAEKVLQETILKINTTARELFIQTFSKIRENFQQIFGLLFEGGEADLAMEADADPLDARIDIVARPSGKRLQAIQLLSGGEKALTAIALLLAIYRVKPSPFCILDEVDAPLDDANIDRFVRVLKEFSKDTQWIVVTHNKRTMEAAKFIYGVTMEEDGVSKLISVQMN